jgi:NitT/TauT family transport system ATP-binding protein
MTNALETRALNMSFGTHLVLDHIDLSVADGEFLSIVGPSGCGKTTLLRLLAGLTAPSSGEILAEGKPITGPSRDRAIVFQDYSRSLLPWRSVWTNVALAFEGQGISRAARKTRSYALLEQMGLAQVGEYFPGQLSGGMQQRVQIARALINEPDILLMDEPFGALDYQTRLLMQKLLLRLWAHFRPTILFITHDVGEAIFISDRVIAMTRRPGRVKVVVDVHAPKPRDYEFLGSPEFTRLEHELVLAVQSEVEGREAEAVH